MKKLLKKVVDVFLWIWQLPQNIIGMIILLVNIKGKYKSCVSIMNEKVSKQVNFYFVPHLFNSGISLGNYIIVDKFYDGYFSLNIDIAHEYGHQVQSKILGPLYLLLIGLISFLRNIYDRFAHINWTVKERETWYYKTGFLHIVESNADAVVGVVR